MTHFQIKKVSVALTQSLETKHNKVFIESWIMLATQKLIEIKCEILFWTPSSVLNINKDQTDFLPCSLH